MGAISSLLGSFVGVLMIVAIVVVVFLVCRAIILWYWKIDKIEEHLADIRKVLNSQALNNRDKE